jgi:hypothetical protein
MAHTIYAGKVNKRRNSTFQPSLSDSFNVLLKTPTSLHAPTFTINASAFDFNYLKWDDRYYFVTDIVARNNNLWDVSAVIDVLATYKFDILSSTQYVSYSSVSGGVWLPDTRIPLVKNPTTRTAQTSITPLSSTGTYILSVVGKNGVASYVISPADLILLINDLQIWIDQLQDAAAAIITGQTTNVPQALNEIGKALTQSGFIGNSYQNAVQGIRGCVWVPFNSSRLNSTNRRIWIGNYDTGLNGGYLTNKNITDSFSVTIPWFHSDWRRAVCEDVYLYLPLVGNVQLSTDSIAHSDSLTISYSLAPITGEISYRVNAGAEVIGTYGASAGADIPVGINQAASLGSVAQSALSGISRTVSSGNVARGLKNFAVGAYDVVNTVNSTNMTTIGGIGGSSGVGVGTSCLVSVVNHETLIAPATMAATMGVPTMKPLTLSSCKGFCQCVNAHVSAPAEAQELEEIDNYLNSGFYIE